MRRMLAGTVRSPEVCQPAPSHIMIIRSFGWRRGDFIDEYLHADAVGVGKDQGVKFAVGDGNGGIRIGILLGNASHSREDEQAEDTNTAGCRRCDQNGLRVAWNITLIGPFPDTTPGRFQEMSFGEFFFHSSWFSLSTFGVLFVRGKLSPSMTVEEIVSRSQCGGPLQVLVQFPLDLADDQDPSFRGFLEERCKKRFDTPIIAAVRSMEKPNSNGSATAWALVARRPCAPWTTFFGPLRQLFASRSSRHILTSWGGNRI